MPSLIQFALKKTCVINVHPVKYKLCFLMAIPQPPIRRRYIYDNLNANKHRNEDKFTRFVLRPKSMNMSGIYEP